MILSLYDLASTLCLEERRWWNFLWVFLSEVGSTGELLPLGGLAVYFLLCTRLRHPLLKGVKIPTAITPYNPGEYT